MSAELPLNHVTMYVRCRPAAQRWLCNPDTGRAGLCFGEKHVSPCQDITQSDGCRVVMAHRGISAGRGHLDERPRGLLQYMRNVHPS